MLSTKNKVRFMSVFVILAMLFSFANVTPAAAGSKVTHHVSAGGPDACVAFGFEHPGCNGNYSLVGTVSADGSMSGQYTDRLINGDGFHAVIDCVSVVGNDAWVSGVITKGTYTLANGDVVDLTGYPVTTRIRDNGTSAKDPADQIGYSVFSKIPCTAHAAFPLLDTPEGQVVIK